MMSSTPGEPDVHAYVMVTFMQPFRLVLREGDTWHCDAEKLNERAYDREKLARISTHLTIASLGSAPPVLLVGFDGSLILPMTVDFAYGRGRPAIDVLNSLLGYLLMGGVYCDAVDPSQVMMGEVLPTGFVRLFGGSRNLPLNFRIREGFIGAFDGLFLCDPPTITTLELERAGGNGEAVFEAAKRVSPALIARGVTSAVQRDWSEALANLWIAVEQATSELWHRRVLEQCRNSIEPISGRSDMLSDHRTFTTSVRHEFLFQKGVINSEAYRSLNVARKARNALAHDGKHVKEEDVTVLLVGLSHLLEACGCGSQQQLHATLSKPLVPSPRDGDNPDRRSGVSVSRLPLPGDESWTGNIAMMNVPVLPPIQKWKWNNRSAKRSEAGDTL